MSRKDLALFLSLLTLGLIIRLVLSNYLGAGGGDIYSFNLWAESLYKDGLLNVYKNTSLNLPPLFAYIHYLISYPAVELKNYSLLFLKLPGAVFDICISVMIFFIVRNEFVPQGLSKRAPFISMSLFLFNPAVIFVSAIWGKWDDPLLSLLLILTVYKYGTYKEGVYYSLSILAKIQGLLLAPLLIRIKGLSKLIIPFVLTSIVVLLPFVDSLGAIYDHVIKFTFGSYQHITINSFNFWWLFNWSGWGKEWFDAPSDIKLYYLIIPQYFGFQIYALVWILLIIYLRIHDYKLRHLCFASFFIYFTFFMFFTRIHERYMYYCLPFLVLIVFLERKFLYAYVVLCTTFLLNLYIVYTPDPAEPFYFMYKIPAFSVGISVINLIVYFYLLVYLVKNVTPNFLNRRKVSV
jgi:hypothetical protein